MEIEGFECPKIKAIKIEIGSNNPQPHRNILFQVFGKRFSALISVVLHVEW